MLTTGVLKRRLLSAKILWVSMPVTVLVMLQPWKAVSGAKPGAVCMANSLPWYNTAMPRVLAAIGSPAPTKAFAITCCKAASFTPAGHWSLGEGPLPAGQGRGSPEGLAKYTESPEVTLPAPSSTQPRLGNHCAVRGKNPANVPVTRFSFSSTFTFTTPSAGEAGNTSCAISPSTGRLPTNAAEQTPLAAMPAAILGMLR